MFDTGFNAGIGRAKTIPSHGVARISADVIKRTECDTVQLIWPLLCPVTSIDFCILQNMSAHDCSPVGKAVVHVEKQPSPIKPEHFSARPWDSSVHVDIMNVLTTMLYRFLPPGKSYLYTNFFLFSIPTGNLYSVLKTRAPRLFAVFRFLFPLSKATALA